MVATAIGIPERLAAVVRSFDVFCDDYAKIEDKRTRRAIRFGRYPDQRWISTLLNEGKWLVCLKARQCGITWLVAVYVVWCMITKPGFEVVVLQQDKSYAKAFLRRVRFIYRNLPPWLQIPMKDNNRFELSFRHPDGESILTAIAGSDAAGRSMTVNLIIFDEHAYIPQAQESREGCEFSVERSDGQIVSISTAAGMYGDFYEVFSNAPENKYYPIFLSWRSVPDRTDEWYASEERRLSNNPVRLKRELPNTPAEAFMMAEGRCYPSFDPDRHVRTFEQVAADLNLHWEHAELHRGIDFGDVSPFACLWVAHWRDHAPGFTVDPSCVNLNREMLAYHFDEKARKKRGKDRPVKLDDHACFPAGTMIETMLYGEKSIDDIRRGDIVRTHRGWAYVEVGSTPTGIKPVLQVTLEDGRWVRCTADHPFALADGGFCRADELTDQDDACVYAPDDEWRRTFLARRSAPGERKKSIPDEQRLTKKEKKLTPLPTPVPLTAWDLRPDPKAIREMPIIGMRRAKVAKVEKLPDPVKVYSIATEHGTHLANGILVSNCDALRYAVMYFDMQGHVHLYREFYVEDSTGKGRTDLHDIEDIHKLSGWVPGEPWEKAKWKRGPKGEDLAGTVADRSRRKSIDLYNAMDLLVDPYKHPLDDAEVGGGGDEIMDGIRRLNLLIDGTRPINKTVVLSVEQQRELSVEREMRGLSRLPAGSCDLQEAAYRDTARQAVLRRQHFRQKRSGANRYRPYGRCVA